MKIIEWFASNWDVILMVSGAVLSLASIVTKLTPTPTDDKVVDFIKNLLARLSVLQPKGVSGVKAPLTKPKEVVKDNPRVNLNL